LQRKREIKIGSKTIKFQNIFIVLILFFSFSLSSSTTQSNFESHNKNNNSINTFSFDEINTTIMTIFKFLETVGEKTNSSIKWSQYLNKFDDGPILQYYPGQRGMAGIGHAIFKLYNETKFQYFYDIIIKTGNYLISSYIEDGYSVKWRKSESELQFWTSYRYGNSGIIPFLLDLYFMTDNKTYLDIATRAGNWLLSVSKINSTDSIYWLTAGENGFISTDYYYGVAGVVDSLIELYSKTNNATFLESAIKGANWILKSKIVTNNTNNAGYIPWTTAEIEFFKDFAYTGRLNGITGIGNVLLHLFKATKDNQWLDQSKQLAFWLQSTDFNDTGMYPNGGAPYITDLYEGAANILDFGSGSLGVADFFLNLYLVDKDIKWLYEIIRITSTIENIMSVINNNYLPQQKNTSLYYTGLNSGLGGLIKIYSDLVYYFNYSNHNNILNSSINIMNKLILSNNGNITEIIYGKLINTNAENGIASLLESFSNIYKLKKNNYGIYEKAYDKAILTLPDPLITLSKTSGANIVFLTIITFFVLVKYKKISG
jgi:lantibiotic modifying enzyme